MSENTSSPIEPFGELRTLTPYKKNALYRTDGGDLYRATQDSSFESGHLYRATVESGHYRTPIELIELAPGHTVRTEQ